jgi:hypothetical protein
LMQYIGSIDYVDHYHCHHSYCLDVVYIVNVTNKDVICQ